MDIQYVTIGIVIDIIIYSLFLALFAVHSDFVFCRSQAVQMMIAAEVGSCQLMMVLQCKRAH